MVELIATVLPAATTLASGGVNTGVAAGESRNAPAGSPYKDNIWGEGSPYIKALQQQDVYLGQFVDALKQSGKWEKTVMFITGDHGCDPTSTSTDHTRERTPLLAAGLSGGPHTIGTRASFGDLGHTIGRLLGADVDGLEGQAFLDRIGFA